MKKCEVCNKTYADDTLSFCLSDGALLLQVWDPENTLVIENDDTAVRNTKPNTDSQSRIGNVLSQPQLTSSTIRPVTSGNSSPHMIYAGVGLISIVALIVTFVWWTKQDGTRNSVNAPSTIGNGNRVSNTNTVVESAEPPPLRPRQTRPQGEIQNSGFGPYYRNYANNLEIGVAYKYPNNPEVFVYDGQFLQSIESEQKFLNFYGCGNMLGHIIDCAPIYEMPSSVTSSMIKSKTAVQSKTESKRNDGSWREMQEKIDSEVKKRIPEANP